MHGIKTNVLLAGTRPISALATAVIGIVATGDDANAATFPLNEPALITDLRGALSKAGTTGTLAKSLAAIYDQASPIVIVVRVPEDDAEQDAAVIGSAGTYTGLHALLAAESKTGFRPRILGAPGLDNAPVTAALVAIAPKLRAMVYAAAIGATIAEVTTYAGTFSEPELMLIWPEWSSGFEGDAVARALGLRAAIDEDQGWHKSISNVTVAGVTGVSESLFFDIQDESTDVAALNTAKITTLIRSPAGGFVYWGNRTLSSDPLLAFEPAIRSSQILQDEIAAGLIWAMDKPLTKFLIKDVIETINARLRSLVAEGRLIGARAWFDLSLNSDTDLAAGKLVIDYEFTPAAPLEGLTLNQRITSKYYAELGAALAAG